MARTIKIAGYKNSTRRPLSETLLSHERLLARHRAQRHSARSFASFPAKSLVHCRADRTARHHFPRRSIPPPQTPSPSPNVLGNRTYCDPATFAIKSFLRTLKEALGPDPFPDFFLTTEFPMTARFTIRSSIRKDPVRFVPASEFRLTCLLRLRTGDGR